MARPTPCWGYPLEDFFPRDREPISLARPRIRLTAEHLCAECPIRERCRKEGANGQLGLWGGVLYWSRNGRTIAAEPML